MSSNEQLLLMQKNACWKASASKPIRVFLIEALSSLLSPDQVDCSGFNGNS